MSADVLGLRARGEMSETDAAMVAQQHRNRRRVAVAQRRGDRSPYIKWAGPACALALAAWASVGLGCASSTVSLDGAHRDAASDAAATSCTAACSARGQICSLGRCTSSACATAEAAGNTDVGCAFYTLQADNVTADEAAATTFLVTGQGPDPADVEIEALQPGGAAPAWTAIASAQLAAGGASVRLSVSALEVTSAGVTPAGALRIVSDRPVTVAEIESDDVLLPATSTGGTMLLPQQALGYSYRAVTYPQQTSPDVADTVGSRGGAARVIVVGTAPATAVTFTPVGPVTHDPAGATPDLAPGQPFGFTLGDGDVFQIYTGAEGEDLTGALVTASAPVAVFSGNISTSYGSQVVGINSADMAHEEMPPVAGWSDTYVAAALTPQASIGCTSFFGADGGSIWRVVAAQDGTSVTASGPTVAPVSFTLDAGGATSLVEAGSFVVTADKPILVTQGLDCEPSLSLASAVGGTTLFKKLPVAVPSGFDLLLGIVRQTGTEVELDGAAIGDDYFQSVGGGFDVAAVPLPACAPGGGVCTYTLTAPSGVAASVRGMDVRSSYVLGVPLLVGCDPSSGLCLN